MHSCVAFDRCQIHSLHVEDRHIIDDMVRRRNLYAPADPRTESEYQTGYEDPDFSYRVIWMHCCKDGGLKYHGYDRQSEP